MNILSERAAITQYAGNDDLNAEVVVNDNGKTVYINAHKGDDCDAFTASNVSVFNYATGATEDIEDEAFDYIEEFEELEETKKSKYAKYYVIADRMINDIANSYNEPSTKILKPLDDLLKEHPNITIKEAMDMGYSYGDIVFG